MRPVSVLEPVVAANIAAGAYRAEIATDTDKLLMDLYFGTAGLIGHDSGRSDPKPVLLLGSASW